MFRFLLPNYQKAAGLPPYKWGSLKSEILDKTCNQYQEYAAQNGGNPPVGLKKLYDRQLEPQTTEVCIASEHFKVTQDYLAKWTTETSKREHVNKWRIVPLLLFVELDMAADHFRKTFYDDFDFAKLHAYVSTRYMQVRDNGYGLYSPTSWMFEINDPFVMHQVPLYVSPLLMSIFQAYCDHPFVEHLKTAYYYYIVNLTDSAWDAGISCSDIKWSKMMKNTWNSYVNLMENMIYCRYSTDIKQCKCHSRNQVAPMYIIPKWLVESNNGGKSMEFSNGLGLIRMSSSVIMHSGSLPDRPRMRKFYESETKVAVVYYKNTPDFPKFLQTGPISQSFEKQEQAKDKDYELCYKKAFDCPYMINPTAEEELRQAHPKNDDSNSLAPRHADKTSHAIKGLSQHKLETSGKKLMANYHGFFPRTPGQWVCPWDESIHCCGRDGIPKVVYKHKDEYTEDVTLMKIHCQHNLMGWHTHALEDYTPEDKKCSCQICDESAKEFERTRPQIANLSHILGKMRSMKKTEKK